MVMSISEIMLKGVILRIQLMEDRLAMIDERLSQIETGLKITETTLGRIENFLNIQLGPPVCPAVAPDKDTVYPPSTFQP